MPSPSALSPPTPQVLGADVIVPEALRLKVGQAQDVAGAVFEAVVHGRCLLGGRCPCR
jgi:hypothetical protein